MKARFQQLCAMQQAKLQMDNVDRNKGNGAGNEVSLGNIELKGSICNAHVYSHFCALEELPCA